MAKSDAQVTVFIPTYNRIDTLERTLDSYRRFTTPYEIVVVDNGTSHPAALAVLEAAAGRPDVAQIYNLPKIRSLDDLTRNVSRAMRDRYRQGTKTPWFAVSDADICFDGTSPEALDAYIRLAEATGKVPGPHTRVDHEIPMGYPLRSRVLVCESRILYKSQMRWLGEIPYGVWAIDSTFHLFPRVSRFNRLKMDTLRCGPPYDAMHLDWYSNIFNPTEENQIYITDPGIVSSWGGGWIRDFWVMFQNDQERAFTMMLDAALGNQLNDLRNEFFILSWCLQNGIANESFPPGEHRLYSRRMLGAALPSPSVYHDLAAHWLRMIYHQDFSMLGWS